MSQCTQFSALCTESPQFPLCPNSNPPTDDPRIPKPPPMMQMYFHFGLSEYILFKPWVPRTAFQYVVSCLILFSVSVFYEWFLNYQKQWERKSIAEYQSLLRQGQQGQQRQQPVSRIITLGVGGHQQDQEEAQRLLSNHPSSSSSSAVNNNPQRTRLPNAEARMKMARLRIYKACMRVFGSSLGYMLMLITMTFNVGLCLAVVVGYGVGSFLYYFDGVEMVGAGMEGVGEDADLCCGYE
ncbi:UNVERIFIED_CONTAM: hypothetical protein HDU68_003545 [Siphonaria sp. JEL0065]|nr:hypothetical protein HDU68_003545 [Siphonaria sp. JEL0065]